MSSPDGFLGAAEAIARRIVDEAIWHRGRCTWMGAVGEPAHRARPEYRPLGPLVYDGTAGVGLFLAQVAGMTGDAGMRGTAVGALRHAVERGTKLPPSGRDGFQGGAFGIAWAADRVAALLAHDDVRAAPVDRRRGNPAARVPDLVLGAAGTAVVLLALGDVDGATDAGETLLAQASVTPRGWSWADPARPGSRHRCGVAHGAGGIGWALLELFAATGDARFETGAREAFAYERSWLDGTSGAFSDLRPNRRRDGMTGTWCYGEAGIALSRLRAAAVLGDGPHCLDADISVMTTRRHLLARLPYAIDDLSLCHGAGGAAAALLVAGDRDAAAALANVAIERHGREGDWPCGVYGTTPGLYRGSSGIGWLFLCLHDPCIPSPLALPIAVDHAVISEYVRFA
jgi:lantibiotic modifying enzyme